MKLFIVSHSGEVFNGKKRDANLTNKPVWFARSWGVWNGTSEGSPAMQKIACRFRLPLVIATVWTGAALHMTHRCLCLHPLWLGFWRIALWPGLTFLTHTAYPCIYDSWPLQVYMPYEQYSVPGEVSSPSLSEEEEFHVGNPNLELSDSDSDENLSTGFDSGGYLCPRLVGRKPYFPHLGFLGYFQGMVKWNICQGPKSKTVSALLL